MKTTNFHFSRLFVGLLLVLSLSSTGCLVIGGKTHICANEGKFDSRVAQLENRIITLEQYAGISPPLSPETQISVASLTTEVPLQQPEPIH